MNLSWSPKPLLNSTVVIGNFDGVHLGHQSLFNAAKKHGDPVLALTFSPHPMSVFAPEKAPTLLTTHKSKVKYLLAAGADSVGTISFDKTIADLVPKYFEEFLRDQLKVKRIVVGENFTYGKGAVGNVASLKAAGFEIHLSDLLDKEGTISSSRIRQLITSGDVVTARELLGRHFKLEGVVVHGEKRGREIGYPTANLGSIENWTIPADGIYAGWLRVDNQTWPAAISIGTNPTFIGVRGRQVEAYALDEKDLDLYDKEAEVFFGWRLRDTLKFDGLDPLLEQMALDCNQTKELTAGGIDG